MNNNNSRSIGEMRIKEDAPLLSRSASPERKYFISLADIPETMPGPNAFARHAARVERHRLDSNAFYQQEAQKRTATPPDMLLHPAFRARSSSDPPTPPRNSSCTTMSPFVNAHQSAINLSPPLKLVPSDSDMAEPTRRGMIEDRFERIQHERSGSKDQRTPVFTPTPKIACSDFESSKATPPKKRSERHEGSVELASKTPKKGFLGKLKLTGNLRGTSSPSTVTLGSLSESLSDHRMPVKAQAVLGKSPPKGRHSLGSSPSKISIARSPSKRKNFFSRKTPNAAAPNTSSPSLGHPSDEAEEPATATSDPSHYSYQDTLTASYVKSGKVADKAKGPNQCAITRSQSLKYFDQALPPTPPAKNTPPDERAKRQAARTNLPSKLPFHTQQTTPSKDKGVLSTSDRLSPTRFGTYGYKEMPVLITRPSLYSMRASVVPNLTEAHTFEEMKARVDGLSLEGFNTPAENVRDLKQGNVYSPSVYSSAWTPRPNSVLITSPQVGKETERISNGASMHTKGSSSSGGEIQICYPGLAKDPFVSTLTAKCGSNVTLTDIHQAREHPEVRQPRHGHTYSRDHSTNPRHSADSTIFAHHVANEYHESSNVSPTSFNHPSAAPSPLQFLPATVYVPPPRSATRPQIQKAQTMHDGQDGANQDLVNALGIKTPQKSNFATPRRSNTVFDNAPSFPADAQNAGRTRTPSPLNSVTDSHFGSDVDVDPRKSSPAKPKSPATAKLDRVLDLLNKMQARDNEVAEMRAEMRETREKVDRRLSAMEKLRELSPTPATPTATTTTFSSVTSEIGPTGHGASDEGRRESRVLTGTALDFYRQAHAESGSAPSVGGRNDDMNNAEAREYQSFDELKETNRLLLEIVGGFAGKIEALEKKELGFR